MSVLVSLRFMTFETLFNVIGGQVAPNS